MRLFTDVTVYGLFLMENAGMKIVKITNVLVDFIAPMAADFRVTLKLYKGIRSKPDVAEGKKEIEEYLSAGFPVFAAICGSEYAGYVVCRVEEPCVWMESIFVKSEYRRQGIASALLAKAENIAKSYGEDTVYHYVHPNNYKMINFLRKHGYTVLNLVEIRKPYAGEKLTQRICVGESEFDY